MSAERCNPPRAGRRHWLALTWRIARLAVRQPDRTADLVRRSYDGAAAGYDAAWTSHMRTLSLAMLDRLDPPPGAECIDLGCGTGFITAELARRAGRPATGVDDSDGMLAVARAERGGMCRFIRADAAEFLRRRPARSADAIACAWALGYTHPLAVIRRAAAVLRPGGRLGIIDNSLFSLAEVLWAAAKTFAERPAALRHVMKVRFLPHPAVLAAVVRACGLRVRWSAGGGKTYCCLSGAEAIERLRATGAAAGFELAAHDADKDWIFARFAQVIEELLHEHRHGHGHGHGHGGGHGGGGLSVRAGAPAGVPITHRWLACVGDKP